MIPDNITSFLRNDFVNELVRPKGDLLYLALHGSRLYGFSSDESDYDFKGVFLPNKNDVLCYERTKSISLKDKVDGVKVEVEVWSLQHFLLHCLAKCDTNGLDLLFSWTNKDAVLYEDGILFFRYLTVSSVRDYILNNKMSGLLGYINRQCDLYGIKGKRLKEVNHLINQVMRIPNPPDTDFRLRDMVPMLDLDGYEYIKLVTNVDGEEVLDVLGRTQPLYLKPHILIQQLTSIKDSFGKRSAKSMSGTDYKALAHAYRGCVETLELYEKGIIEFPLECSGKLYDIKHCNCDVSSIKSEIVDMIDKLESMKPFNRDSVDINFLKFIITSYYN